MLLYITLSNMLFSVKPPDENGMRIETTHALAATGATLFLTARNTAEPQSVLDTNITQALRLSCNTFSISPALLTRIETDFTNR